MIVLIMGVEGAGKTTVGRVLARDLGWPFYDADDFHPEANRLKMARGEALTDADRESWLDALRNLIGGITANAANAVLACSALKQKYRDALTGGGAQVRIVHLDGTPQLIRERLRARHGHFAGEALLQSQLETLERPANAITVDVANPPEQIAATIRAGLGL